MYIHLENLPIGLAVVWLGSLVGIYQAHYRGLKDLTNAWIAFLLVMTILSLGAYAFLFCTK